MRVAVRLAGPLVDWLGFRERELEIPPRATGADLLGTLGIDRNWSGIVGRNGWAIDANEALADGDRILLSPIFSGG
jgi:sulfur carrier protein ThiS